MFNWVRELLAIFLPGYVVTYNHRPEHMDIIYMAGYRRSNQWPKVRKLWLKNHPCCAVCGGVQDLEVHHKMPFHLDESKELDETNLITLCESKHNGVNCHLLFGHLGSFTTFNPNVEADVAAWNDKLKNRYKVQETEQ